MAGKSPLVIQKNGKDAMVLLSYDLFDKVKKSVWVREIKEVCAQSGKAAKKRRLTAKKLTAIPADLKQERIRDAHLH